VLARRIVWVSYRKWVQADMRQAQRAGKGGLSLTWDPIHERGIPAEHPSCHNHPPYKDDLLVQDGWTDDGRRVMVKVPNRMSRECHQWDEEGAARMYGWNCEGCRWLKY